MNDFLNQSETAPEPASPAAQVPQNQEGAPLQMHSDQPVSTSASQPMPQPASPSAPLDSSQTVPQEPFRHSVHHSYIWLGSLRFAGMLMAVFFFSLMSSGVGALAKGDFASSGGVPGLLITGVGILVGLLFIVGITAAYQVVSYKHLYYTLGSEEFNLYSGIFSKKRVHIPYQRVQSVNQKATLIQRIAGVCTVNIDTAGGSSNKAVVVPYIQNSEAERLRSELFARKQAVLSGSAIPAAQAAYSNAATSAGSVGSLSPESLMGQPGHPGYFVGTPGPMGQPGSAVGNAGSTNVLDMPAEIMTDVRGVFGGAAVSTGTVSYEYGMSNKELVLTGFSNNTGFVLMVLAIVGSVAGVAGQAFDTALGKMVMDGGVDLMMQTFAGNAIWAITAIVMSVMAVVWLFSIIGTSISYGGFRACRRDNRIEVEQGLLQHQFHGVDVDRVQSVVIKQSFIRRLFGYCELSLGKIDAAAEDGSDQSQQLNPQGLIIHPFVKMSRVPEILAGLIPEFAEVPTNNKPVARVAMRRALVRRCILQGSGFWLAVVAGISQIAMNAFSVQINADFPGLLVYLNAGAAVAYVVCVLLLVLDVIGAVLWFRGSGFAFNRAFLQISNGGFSRESVSIPRKKIQYGFTQTNPFQRASQVATINARTAAGVGGTTLRLMDVRKEDAGTWLEWVLPGRNMIE